MPIMCAANRVDVIVNIEAHYPSIGTELKFDLLRRNCL